MPHAQSPYPPPSPPGASPLGPRRPRRAWRTPVLVVAGAGVLAAGVAGIASLTTASSSSNSSPDAPSAAASFRTPDLTARTLEEARAALATSAAAADLPAPRLVRRPAQYSETVPRGYVLSQQPPADAVRSSVSVVAVVLSKGTARIKVPRIAQGVSLGSARSTLRRLDLRVKASRQKSWDVPAGQVISTSPSAGSQVRRPAVVRLMVSSGPPPDPLVDPVSVVSEHWANRQAGDLSTAWDALTPGMQSRIGGFSRWESDHQTDGLYLADFQGHVGSNDRGRATVVVDSLTTQAASSGCNSWTGSYDLMVMDGRWRISAVSLDRTPCDQVSAPVPDGEDYAVPEEVPADDGCDPNYEGACVPDVPYDLDCADIDGPVYVVGSDPHGFDGDNDGVGCEW